MEEQSLENLQQNDSVRRILFAIRKSWILIILIVALFIGGGFAYSRLRKPIYNASQSVIYKAMPKKGSSGASEGDAQITYQYLSTVADFCDEGCVVDRANFYWKKFVEYRAKDPALTVREFVKQIKAAEEGDDLYYTLDKIDATSTAYSGERISVASSKNGGGSDISFKMTLSLTDSNRADAVDKVKLLVTAINQEAVALKQGAEPDSEDYKYFYVKVNLEDYGDAGVYSDINITRILTVFAIIGLAVALVVVYLKNVLNRTVRDKEELEFLTGTNVLSFIEDQGGN